MRRTPRLIRTHQPLIISVAVLIFRATALTGQEWSQQAIQNISVNAKASPGSDGREAAPFQTVTGDIIRADDDDSKNKDKEKNKNRIRIHVDSQAPLYGDGSRSAPFQTITDAIIRAREIRSVEPTRIIILVAPGTYTENYP